MKIDYNRKKYSLMLTKFASVLAFIQSAQALTQAGALADDTYDYYYATPILEFSKVNNVVSVFPTDISGTMYPQDGADVSASAAITTLVW